MSAPLPQRDVMTVVITGAAGQIGYSLAPLIAQGLMLGPSQKIQLKLLDLEQAANSLAGVQMELRDCSYPLLQDVVITSDARVAFTGADVAILCGAFPRRPGMERKDLLTTNANIFRTQGALIKEVAHAHCRILVVGNPANTNALLLSLAAAGGIDARNVTALTRLDHNRAVGFAKSHLASEPALQAVVRPVIWGNHSATQVPDVESLLPAGTALSATHLEYFHGAFVTDVQQRGAAVMKLRGLSSALSAAKAIVDHVHDWVLGSEGRVVSMAVLSDGNPYGVPAGLIYSFPVVCAPGGTWSFVTGLKISEAVQQRLNVTTAELQEEKELGTAPAA